MPEPILKPEDQPGPHGVPAAAPEAAELRSRLAAAEQALSESREALDAARTRERHLARELQHRVRNNLAVIRSIYRRSRESGASQDEFVEHFEGRLNAVARNQSAMAGLSSYGLDLEDMVRNELLEVHWPDGPGLSIAGPPVRLHEQVAELMGLAIHELTTNAIKFGALYHDGRLNVDWSIGAEPAAGTLRFHWREEGVAALARAPRRKGFGRQLIEEALPYQLGGTSTFELKPGGVDCTIVLPGVADRSSPPEPGDDDDGAFSGGLSEDTQ